MYDAVYARDVLYLNPMQGSAGWANVMVQATKQLSASRHAATNRLALSSGLMASQDTPIALQRNRICTVDMEIWRRLQAFAGDCRVVPVVRPKGLAFRYCRFPVPTPRTVSKEQGCSDCVFAGARLS